MDVAADYRRLTAVTTCQHETQMIAGDVKFILDAGETLARRPAESF
jgi:hypothetical protein